MARAFILLFVLGFGVSGVAAQPNTFPWTGNGDFDAMACRIAMTAVRGLMTESIPTATACRMGVTFVRGR